MSSDFHLELIALSNYADFSKNGQLSINGIFDEIFAPEIPSQFLRGFLVLTIAGAKESTEYDILVKIINPAGEVILQNNAIINAGRTGKGNFIAELVGLPLPSLGEYKVSLSYKDDEIGSTSFFVTKISADQNGKKKKTSN